MAKVKYSEFVDALDAAAALDGTETVVVIQDGAPVETTTQDIADLGGVGAVPTVSAKTADFTANGASGTIYTNAGAGATVTATLDPDTATGTSYVFLQTDGTQSLHITPPDGHGFYLNIEAGPIFTTGDGIWTMDTNAKSGRLEITKIGGTEWYGSAYGITFND